VGDEAVVAYRGRHSHRYLAVVGGVEGGGSDAVRYAVAYDDGDTEEGVKRTAVVAIDKAAQAAATPPMGEADEAEAATTTLVPLPAGTAVMAEARGFGKWFSGCVTRVRAPAAASRGGGGEGGRGDGAVEWVYDVVYDDEETETAMCSALIAPVAPA